MELSVCLSLTDLSDEDPELVEVAVPLRGRAQFPDDLVEPLRPFHRVLRSKGRWRGEGRRGGGEGGGRLKYDLMSLYTRLSTHPLVKSKLRLLVVSNLLYELTYVPRIKLYTRKSLSMLS